MPIGLMNCSIYQEKYARHLLQVSSRHSDPVPLKKRDQHAQNTFVVDVLAPMRPHQTERLVELSFWIGEARQICQSVRGKEFLRFLLPGKMHKGQLCSFGFNLFPHFAQLGDRLATERSTEVS